MMAFAGYVTERFVFLLNVTKKKLSVVGFAI